jgi:hypothetical protein
MSVSGTLASSDFPSEVLGLAGACTWNRPSFQSDRCNDSTLGNLKHNRINNDLIIQFHPYYFSPVLVSHQRGPKSTAYCKMSRIISYKVFKMCC